MGQRLLEHCDMANPGVWVFTVIDHLNHAASLVRDPDEKLRLVHLNLIAADESRKAVSLCEDAQILQCYTISPI